MLGLDDSAARLAQLIETLSGLEELKHLKGKFPVIPSKISESISKISESYLKVYEFNNDPDKDSTWVNDILNISHSIDKLKLPLPF